MKPSLHVPISSPTPASSRRRQVLQIGAAGAALGLLGAPGLLHAQAGPKIRIGYWPIAAGLPFYSAIELGYFKEAGLDVEPLKFAGAQQVMEAVLSGRADGTANGTGSANIAIGEIAQPGTFKIFCSNPSNVKNVLDEVIVPVASPAKVMADLKGKRIGSGPGIQHVGSSLGFPAGHKGCGGGVNLLWARASRERQAHPPASTAPNPAATVAAGCRAGPIRSGRSSRNWRGCGHPGRRSARDVRLPSRQRATRPMAACLQLRTRPRPTTSTR